MEWFFFIAVVLGLSSICSELSPSPNGFNASLFTTLVVSAKGGVSLPSSGVAETGFRLVLAWSGRGGRDRTGCGCRTVCGSDRRSSTTLAGTAVGSFTGEEVHLQLMHFSGLMADLIDLKL